MAVNKKTQKTPNGEPKRLLLGTNVLVMCVLAIAIVVFAQVLAYNAPRKWDMTSSGINSLSTGTKNLLTNLDQQVRLTSLYFEADIESEDQQRYRRVVEDLLGLYAANNRGKITADWANPVSKSRERFNGVLERIAEHPSFKDDLQKYKERVDAYISPEGLGVRINVLLQDELNQIGALGMAADGETQKAVGPIEVLLTRWSQELSNTQASIEREANASPPQYSGSVQALKQLYKELGDNLQQVQGHAERMVATNPNVAATAAAYLRGCGERYASLINEMTQEKTRLDELEPPKFDEIIQKLSAPTSNAIVVETETDVGVVEFATCWPPMDPSGAGAAGFDQRAFRGEEKVTAAILRATHKEQTAIVFVRYGGVPLVSGGMMPGMPRSPYMVMKEHLDDANFMVREWDLKTNDAPPTMDPEPTRTIFVVLKPTPPQRGPMGQPSQEPPFTDKHRDLLTNALKDNGRAIFVAGWSPGPFGPIASTYEFSDYLKDEWGITLNNDSLLMRTVSIAPGKFAADARRFYFVEDVTVGDHIVVSGPQQPFNLPWCAPMDLATSPPEGVTVTKLLEAPESDTLWGVKDIGQYEKQLQEQQFMTRINTDRQQSFTLAAAAEKGDSKIIVVGSRAFAEDAVAFARELVFGARGLQVITRNPGNVSLFVNSLHWLNDNTEFMNIGSPIDLAVLSVDSPSTVKVVQGLTIVVWPSLALFGGIAAWWIRRR